MASTAQQRFVHARTQPTTRRVCRAAASTASMSDALQVVCVPALSDNYIWLAHEPRSGKTAVVDPAEVAPVNAALKER